MTAKPTPAPGQAGTGGGEGHGPHPSQSAAPAKTPLHLPPARPGPQVQGVSREPGPCTLHLPRSRRGGGPVPTTVWDPPFLPPTWHLWGAWAVSLLLGAAGTRPPHPARAWLCSPQGELVLPAVLPWAPGLASEEGCSLAHTAPGTSLQRSFSGLGLLLALLPPCWPPALSWTVSGSEVSWSLAVTYSVPHSPLGLCHGPCLPRPGSWAAPGRSSREEE